jgi:hypothetical protein
MNIKSLPVNSTSFQSEKCLEQRNGKVIKDIELMEYSQNGKVIIRGHVNKKPIYYKRSITPKFRNKHVRFNLGKIKITNKINRTLTPFIKDRYPIDKKKSIKHKRALLSEINNQIKTRKKRTKK